MIYQGSVDLPGGKTVMGEIKAHFAGTVKDWWEGRRTYIIDEEEIDLRWEDGRRLEGEEMEREIIIPYDLFVCKTRIQDYVIEQLLIYGGEPIDAI